VRRRRAVRSLDGCSSNRALHLVKRSVHRFDRRGLYRRKMTFAAFRNRQVHEAIDRLAGAENLAIFVGAGVSAEAGLPPWPLLIERLLSRAAERIQHFGSDQQRAAWVARTMRTELPPSAAGIAQTLLGLPDLPKVLKEELYRPVTSTKSLPSTRFAPGLTAHAIAALRVACDGSASKSAPMKIFTLNYDDLIERALMARKEVNPRDVHSIYWPMSRRPHKDIKVHHLHGVITARKTLGTVVLTDASYHHLPPEARARDSELVGILAHHTCLFLGTSLSDPNIIRYIYQAAEERRNRAGGGQHNNGKLEHVALFTHHSADPRAVLRVREDIARTRLAGALTQAVFLDHYSDMGQFVFEVRNRILESNYRPYEERAINLLRPVLRHVINCNNRRQYDKAQAPLSERLARILRSVVKLLDSHLKAELGKEDLALALWLLDEQGRRMTPWVTTDRIHRGPRLLQSVAVQPDGRWLAARAVCEGAFVGEARSADESRWPYLAGFPLLIDDGKWGRVMVGALTMTTLTDARRTWLGRLGTEGEFLLSQWLNDAVGKWLVTALRARQGGI
jgi:hypothetical protein